MQWAANFLRGWVALRLTGPACEEFFNLCARQGVGFWRVKRGEGQVWTCRVSFWDWRRVPALAEKAGCSAALIRRGGVPGLLWKLRYRYALLAGLVVCLGLVAGFGRVVLHIRVEGNKTVPTGVILTSLRANGVRPGVFGPGLDVRQVSHAVMLDIPELSWMAVNIHGTVCDVLVREGTPRPELMEEDEPAHIVAKYPGVVTHVDAMRGQQLVEEGRTVAAGDTLIDSWVDFVEPEGYQGDMGGMYVRAVGRVRARTWHTLKAAMPLEGTAKALTGREKSRWSLEFFGRRVKISQGGGIPYTKYDKIRSEHALTLPGGVVLPVSLCRETCREYTGSPGPVDPDRAVAVLRDSLTRRLSELASEEEILRVSWAVSQADGLLTLTLLAECEQDIALTVED